jgi:hypothetical protein
VLAERGKRFAMRRAGVTFSCDPASAGFIAIMMPETNPAEGRIARQCRSLGAARLALGGLLT